MILAGCSGMIDDLSPKNNFSEKTETIDTAEAHSLEVLTTAKSADTGIVTVAKNEDGRISLTSVAAGTTTVSVTGIGTDESGKPVLTTVTYDVTVAKDGKITCTESGSETARCETINPQGDNSDFAQTTGAKSNDESIAKVVVNNDGTVTVVAAGEGETKVSVKGTDENGNPMTLIYDVKVDSEGEIEIGKNPTVFRNMTATIDPTETVTGFTTESVTTDDEDGDIITAEKDGNKVTVTSQGEGVTKVHVNGKAPNGDDVSIIYEVTVSDEGEIKIGENPTVFIHKTEEIDPKTDGSLDSVTEATSEPEEIITLTENDKGKYTVTAQKEGETTITIVGKKGDDIITVTYGVTVGKDGTLTVNAPEVKVVYVVSFNSNASNAEGEMAAEYVEKGAPYTIKENAFTREDYAFNGWNTKADGSGTAYNAGATITSLGGSLTLYAQWRSAEGLGVEIGAPKGDISLTSSVDGTKVTFTASGTEEGATLIWKAYKGDTLLSTQSDTKTTFALETAELDAGTYTLTVASGARSATVTIPVVKYTVTFVTSMGDAIEAQVVTEGAKATKPEAPSVEN